jgi:predicted ArsR family transcriptional regulator
MDRGLDTPPSEAAGEALAHPSRRRIASVLNATQAGLTVFEIADAVGLHHNAVRQHLKRLSAAGMVSVIREPPLGRGRPRLRYRLADQRVPRGAAHQELVRTLIAYLVRIGASPDDVEAFGRERGAHLGEPGGRRAVIEAFARLGFAPHEVGTAVPESGVLEIRLDHCPFQEGATGDGGDLICTLHRGMAAGIASRAAEGGVLTGWHPQDPAVAGCLAMFTGLPVEEHAA